MLGLAGLYEKLYRYKSGLGFCTIHEMMKILHSIIPAVFEARCYPKGETNKAIGGETSTMGGIPPL